MPWQGHGGPNSDGGGITAVNPGPGLQGGGTGHVVTLGARPRVSSIISIAGSILTEYAIPPELEQSVLVANPIRTTITATLPDDTPSGWTITVVNAGPRTCIINPPAGETIDGETSLPLAKAGQSVTIAYAYSGIWVTVGTNQAGAQSQRRITYAPRVLGPTDAGPRVQGDILINTGPEANGNPAELYYWDATANEWQPIATKLAATDTIGVVALATDDKADTGTDNQTAVTPKTLRHITGPIVTAAERTAPLKVVTPRRYSPNDLLQFVQTHAKPSLAVAGLNVRTTVTVPPRSVNNRLGDTGVRPQPGDRWAALRFTGEYAFSQGIVPAATTLIDLDKWRALTATVAGRYTIGTNPTAALLPVYRLGWEVNPRDPDATGPWLGWWYLAREDTEHDGPKLLSGVGHPFGGTSSVGRLPDLEIILIEDTLTAFPKAQHNKAGIVSLVDPLDTQREWFEAGAFSTEAIQPYTIFVNRGARYIQETAPTNPYTTDELSTWIKPSTSEVYYAKNGAWVRVIPPPGKSWANL